VAEPVGDHVPADPQEVQLLGVDDAPLPGRDPAGGAAGIPGARLQNCAELELLYKPNGVCRPGVLLSPNGSRGAGCAQLCRGGVHIS
jgi:hypothetical protein